MGRHRKIEVPSDKSVLDQMNDANPGDTVWDTGEPESVKGLHLRVFETGPVFYLKYITRSGVRRRPKLGDKLSLSAAREIAGALRFEVLKGRDPKAEWQGHKNEQTIDEVYRVMKEQYWDTERFKQSGRKKEVGNIYRSRIERPFGKLKLSALSKPEVKRWHDKITAQGPYMANRALEVLSSIYTFALENDLTTCKKPTAIRPNLEFTRKRRPTRDELIGILRKLFAIARDTTHKRRFAAIYIIALFYTGSRPQALSNVLYSHVSDTKPNGIKISMSGKMSYKYLQDETFFIPTPVLDLLNMYPRPPDDRIFWGKGSVQLWKHLTKELNCTSLWMRDTRKAFASVGLSAGLSIDLIGEALNHKSAQTTKIYAGDFNDGTVRTTMAISHELDELLK